MSIKDIFQLCNCEIAITFNSLIFRVVDDNMTTTTTSVEIGMRILLIITVNEQSAIKLVLNLFLISNLSIDS